MKKYWDLKKIAGIGLALAATADLYYGSPVIGGLLETIVNSIGLKGRVFSPRLIGMVADGTIIFYEAISNSVYGLRHYLNKDKPLEYNLRKNHNS